MFKKTPLITLIVLIQFHSLPVSAQDSSTSLTESDFFNDIPVVLTATRLKQSTKNSPTATTIIDREMIEASGFTEIVDLLKLAPGMLVNYDSGHIGNAGYQFLFDRYRTRFQVLIDGASVYTPLFGEMPWTQLGITMDDIERIEVIRGPSSSSYGPNAMTGVISIITRHAALDKGARFKLNQGVNGRSEQFATLGSNSGNFDYKLSVGARRDDGFEKRYDSKKLSIANFRGDYQAGNNDILTFSMNYNTGQYQEDASDHLNDSMPQHTKKVTYSTQQGKWEHTFLNGDVFSINFYHQKFDDNNTYIGDYTAGGYGYALTNESVTTRRENIEAMYSLHKDNYNISFGALYRKDNTIAPEYLYQTDKDILTRQFFINSELHINNDNIINLGILRDNNDTGGTTTSPRISFNHHFNSHNTARISYAEASRSPFIMEEYTNRVIYIPDFSTNFTVWNDLSDLKPERIKTVDIGYIGTFNNNATNIDLRLYKNWLSDLIVQDWTALTGGFLQGDAFNITGFEATLSHKFTNTRVILNYAATQIRAVSFNSIPGTKSYVYETGAPKDNVSLLVMHNFRNGMNGSLGYYHTGSYQQLCCEITQQDPRNRIDITFSKSFKIYQHNSKLKLVLQNILNDQVATRLFNNYDRQGYISFAMEL